MRHPANTPRTRCMMAACLALACAGAASAQTQLPAAPTSAPERHVGSVDDALVGLEVVNSAADGSPLAKSHANGFVLRCDGFIVVPSAAFSFASKAPTADPKLIVVFQPGTRGEHRVAFTVGRASFAVRAGYAVFKAPNAPHTPALRALLPDMLKAGDPVEVVWRPWDAAAGRFGPLVRRQAGLGDTGAAVWGGERAALRSRAPAEQKADQPRDPEGFIRFAEPLADAPPGAVVIGPAGMAVGIVGGANGVDKGGDKGGGTGASAGFYSFALLNTVTNCVGASPRPISLADTPDTGSPAVGVGAATCGAAQAGGGAYNGAPAQEGAAHLNEMVRVPGGPVALPPVLLREQTDMAGATQACIAPFEIDAYEVTNGQYLAFWSSLPEKDRADPNVRRALYPLGWGPEGGPFPPELADVPVLGVSLEGAEAYARAQGKRLPTPYEWIKAAFGPRGLAATPAWVARYIADRQAAFLQLTADHDAYLLQNPALNMKGYHDRHAEYAIWPHYAPWIIPNLGVQPIRTPSGRTVLAPGASRLHLRFSRGVSQHIVDTLCAAWNDPLYILPAGSRAYDTSPYGAHDMLLSAHEIYLSNPRQPVRGALRTFRLLWEPPIRDRRTPEHLMDRELEWNALAALGNPVNVPTLGNAAPARWFETVNTDARLSRLIQIRVPGTPRGGPAIRPPTLEITSYVNISDTLALLSPVVGWTLGIDSERIITGMPMIPGEPHPGGPHTPFTFWQYPEWMEPPSHAHSELGFDASGTGPELAPTRRDGVQLTFLVPVGFRCAR